ncbi:ATP-dependent zinc protease family protein [Methylococcus mesophilus]|uniref:ATP-dependent zinc protease family protein n=1 Tax=Methylococcus mesophilus TaxID=2993564 RepID=UPI00224B637E|nr:ATP-dependent zinc protease [Methylococcus mesophilus]UZR28634.1 ATP-dependent zinc protease [Methylococcus mesophilus]
MSFHRTVIVFLLGLFSAVSHAGDAPKPKDKVVMGWLESVFLLPWHLRLTAKLDTGAKTSALHSNNIQRFNRDGREWVRFTLESEDDERAVVVERPLERTVYIKERHKGASKREVVTLTLCKNGREFQTEFTLVDRSNFNYPLLLGRSFLGSVAVVDAGETFVFKAEGDPCNQRGKGAATPTPSPPNGGH